MNADEIEAALPWAPGEEALLLLVREREWAEAYAEEHPLCPLGWLYLDFLRREIVNAMADL